MAERTLVPLVVFMMAIAGLVAFDSYYSAAGLTGYAINTANTVSKSVDCSDSDNNNHLVAGLTYSSIYESGYQEDVCVGNDLLEYYCDGSGPNVRAVSCFFGCTEGACE